MDARFFMLGICTAEGSGRDSNWTGVRKGQRSRFHCIRAFFHGFDLKNSFVLGYNNPNSSSENGGCFYGSKLQKTTIIGDILDIAPETAPHVPVHRHALPGLPLFPRRDR